MPKHLCSIRFSNSVVENPAKLLSVYATSGTRSLAINYFPNWSIRKATSSANVDLKITEEAFTNDLNIFYLFSMIFFRYYNSKFK